MYRPVSLIWYGMALLVPIMVEYMVSSTKAAVISFEWYRWPAGRCTFVIIGVVTRSISAVVVLFFTIKEFVIVCVFVEVGVGLTLSSAYNYTSFTMGRLIILLFDCNSPVRTRPFFPGCVFVILASCLIHVGHLWMINLILFFVFITQNFLRMYANVV